MRARAREEKPRALDPNTDRYVIFSDQHKGARNAADDFRPCERAYDSALAYYYQLGHALIVLGDAEELWEERAGPVLEAYRHTLELEAAFHAAGRYLRLWGNHDDTWSFEDAVDRHLAPLFRGEKLRVHEGLELAVRDGERELGTLLLVHGHQGTSFSDRRRGLARLVVRYIWRPIQRLTGISLNTPARDWRLRERHNVALYEWAAARRKLVLVAGHTHRPVFESQSHPAQIREELKAAAVESAATPDDAERRKNVAELAAELEWVRGQEEQAPGAEGVRRMTKPCYFNTGCCCFLDGDVTGIEIAEGEIRLVRWPDDQDRPRPQILERALVRDVFAAC